MKVSQIKFFESIGIIEKKISHIYIRLLPSQIEL